ncbi:MAG TPA: hypothetical protein VFJ16_01925 [Longimicrobium sp.]|nr:hypothetical protein [Longimicrobium sp.]
MARRMEARQNRYSYHHFMERTPQADARAAVIRDVLRGGNRAGAPPAGATPADGERPRPRASGGRGD